MNVIGCIPGTCTLLDRVKRRIWYGHQQILPQYGYELRNGRRRFVGEGIGCGVVVLSMPLHKGQPSSFSISSSLNSLEHTCGPASAITYASDRRVISLSLSHYTQKILVA